MAGWLGQVHPCTHCLTQGSHRLELELRISFTCLNLRYRYRAARASSTGLCSPVCEEVKQQCVDNMA
jgi:hypothetical protein